MLRRYMGQRFCATFLAFAVVLALLPGSPVGLRATEAAADVEDAPQGGWCAGMAGSEENHASIRLRVDEPAEGGQVAVDEHGKIEINGILHKHADMVDVTEERVAAPEFTIGPPPDGVAAWASSWTTSLRPPHLGSNRLCARAERDPKRTARIQRSFTVVDLIPPSDVPGLTVGNITATSATARWGAATDNYGLAGYEISVDGGAPHQISTGTRSYTVTGLAPLSRHTVSVVAVDLAGNKSETPATASFTTKEPPPPSDSDLTLEVDRAACQPAIRSRCQRKTVSGRPKSRIRRSAPGGNRCSSATGSARSVRGETPSSHRAGAHARRSDAAVAENVSVLVTIGH